LIVFKNCLWDDCALHQNVMTTHLPDATDVASKLQNAFQAILNFILLLENYKGAIEMLLVVSSFSGYSTDTQLLKLHIKSCILILVIKNVTSHICNASEAHQ